MIAPPERVWIVRDSGRPEPARAWVVHSEDGVTALAMPVHPIENEAPPDGPGTAPDPHEGDHS